MRKFILINKKIPSEPNIFSASATDLGVATATLLNIIVCFELREKSTSSKS